MSKKEWKAQYRWVRIAIKLCPRVPWIVSEESLNDPKYSVENRKNFVYLEYERSKQLVAL